jgi:hypothetical protein
VDGTGTAASFNQPLGICTDGTNLYVSDSSGNAIRKIVISSTVVTTLAGPSYGTTDATGSAARFNFPNVLAIDAANSNLYIPDRYNNKIRKLNLATRAVTTYAGTGVAGFADGSVPTTTTVNNTLFAGSVGVNNAAPLAPFTVNNTSGGSGGGSFYSTCNCAMMVFGSNNPLPSDTGGNATALFFSTDYVANGLGASIGLGGRAYDYPSNGGPLMVYGRITGGSDGGGAYGGMLSLATISSGGNMTERMRITSNGYVGINCNAPAYTLDVSGTTQSTTIRGTFGRSMGSATTLVSPFAVFNGDQSTGTGNLSQIEFQYQNGAGYTHYIGSRHNGIVGASSGNAIDFYIFSNAVGGAGSSTAPNTGNVRMMSVTAAGVGIGTGAPAGLLSVMFAADTVQDHSAWTSNWALFGTGANSTTGAALGIGYSASSNASFINSLAPSLAWKNLSIAGSNIVLTCLSSGGVFIGNALGAMPTTAPYMLDVTGTIRTTAGLVFGVQAV